MGCWTAIKLFHNRHEWDRWTSIGENGKSSLQPLIHHPRRSSTKSWMSLVELLDFSNIREFLSFHTDYTMMKIVACQAFLKKSHLDKVCHWSKAAFRLWGKTHFMFQSESLKCHIVWSNWQWSNRWLLNSKGKEHMMHISCSSSMIPIFASLYFVFIFSRSTVHTKISMWWGTSTCHIPLIASWCGRVLNYRTQGRKILRRIYLMNWKSISDCLCFHKRREPAEA